MRLQVVERSSAAELHVEAKRLRSHVVELRRSEARSVNPWRDTAVRLRRLGVHDWYRSVSADAYLSDPWLAFARASNASKETTGALRLVLDLLVRNQPRRISEVTDLLGPDLTAELESQGLLRPSQKGHYRSERCMVMAFDELVLTDWPVETPSKRLISNLTYLSSSSYDCIQRFGARRIGKALDLGSGTGLIAICLSRRADKVLAVDIDEHACEMTRINCAMAGAESVSTLQADWRTLPSTQDFDFIVANPAWRIVPADISYPDPIARVGVGVGGLQRVTEALERLPRLLAAGGSAVIRFDLPLNSLGRCPFNFDPAEILGSNFAFRYDTLAVISADAQSAVSADTCANLNPGEEDLVARFAENYRSLGVASLQQLFCVVTALAS